MKVYVITKGTYSDYHICAVALDKKRAEQLLKMHSGKYEAANIEIFDAEEYQTEADAGLLSYRVEIENERSPKVCRIGREAYSPNVTHRYKWDKTLRVIGYAVDVLAKDEAHALKIGADKIAKYRAEKEGL